MAIGSPPGPLIAVALLDSCLLAEGSSPHCCLPWDVALGAGRAEQKAGGWHPESGKAVQLLCPRSDCPIPPRLGCSMAPWCPQDDLQPSAWPMQGWPVRSQLLLPTHPTASQLEEARQRLILQALPDPSMPFCLPHVPRQQASSLEVPWLTQQVHPGPCPIPLCN